MYVQALLESGPIPYASYNSVTFLAEQVSHHPPGTYAARLCCAAVHSVVDVVLIVVQFLHTLCYIYLASEESETLSGLFN